MERGGGYNHYLNGHRNVRGAQLPDPQVLEHLQEDVWPDPQIQVLSKLLQLCQDLFGRPEVLQILREFGQQIKVPSNPRGQSWLKSQAGEPGMGLGPLVYLRFLSCSSGMYIMRAA